MLFIISSISVNMFDIVTKYDLRQPANLDPHVGEII